MAKVNFTENLKQEYRLLYMACELSVERIGDIDSIVNDILGNRARYENVANSLGVPWFFVAAIHNMESGRKFDRHLHNGDSLNKRTIHVPEGNPKAGDPPFTWEESALDALTLRKIDKVDDWSLTRILYELEGYNGWGYRLYHSHVKSPYLWSYSNHYTSGKYVADGSWSDTAVSKQCGAAAILRRLDERGEIEPLINKAKKQPVLYYSKKQLEHGENMQRFLNTFDGISLLVDGKPGERTSNAVKEVFGFYLSGDPRG